MLQPHRDSASRLLTVLQVADMLGCGRTLVYDLISSRQLPIVKVGRLTRVPVVAVDDFVSRHLTNNMSPPSVAPVHPSRTRRSSAVTAQGAAQVQLFDDA